MHFDLSSSANTLTNFMGSTFLLSLVGGFISYTYLNRFTTCLLFGSLEVLALAMVTFQAASDHLHLNACGKSSCMKDGIGFMFYTSLSLLALGIGGVRGSMTAFGADQFEEKDPNEAKALASFFNWLLLSSTLGAITGVTGFVWISTQRAWHWGFFIITIASSIGFVTLALGKPFYRIKTPGDSPIIRIAQGSAKNLPRSCTSRLSPRLCFFPQYVVSQITTPIFFVNTAYDSWQIKNILAPGVADPHGHWHSCKLDINNCSSNQLDLMQGFRTQFLRALTVLGNSPSKGMFIDSCYAHCQTEMQETWFLSDSPLLAKTVRN